MRSALRRTILTPHMASVANRHREPRGAECMTCLKLVDYEEIPSDQQLNFFASNQPSNLFRCRLRCHGADELFTIDMGSREWTVKDALSLFRRVGYFDPHQHDQAALVGKSDISREDAEPEPTKLVSVGGL